MKKSYGTFVVNITLNCLTHRVTRKVSIPASDHFRDLHLIIQNLMGWSNTEYYEFRFGKTSIIDERAHRAGVAPDTAGVATMISLDDVLVKGKRFKYIYNLNQPWTLNLNVLSREESDEKSSVVLLSGKGAVPPETVQSVEHYYELMTNEKDSAEKDELLAYLENSEKTLSATKGTEIRF